MSELEAKAIYKSLKAKGDLKVLYRGMVGEWSRDKKDFLKQYAENEELIDLYTNGTDSILDFELDDEDL